jgi:hypothetical protein
VSAHIPNVSAMKISNPEIIKKKKRESVSQRSIFVTKNKIERRLFVALKIIITIEDHPTNEYAVTRDLTL